MSDQPTAGPFTPEQEARIRDLIISVAGQRPAWIVETGRMSQAEVNAMVDDYFDRMVLPERVRLDRPSWTKRFMKWLHRFFTALCPVPPLPAPADYSRPLKVKVFDRELRTRQIFAEEDFYSVNRRYPSWAKNAPVAPWAENAPVAPDATAQSDRRPERPAGFWPEQGAGS